MFCFFSQSMFVALRMNLNLNSNRIQQFSFLYMSLTLKSQSNHSSRNSSLCFSHQIIFVTLIISFSLTSHVWVVNSVLRLQFGYCSCTSSVFFQQSCVVIVGTVWIFWEPHFVRLHTKHQLSRISNKKSCSVCKISSRLLTIENIVKRTIKFP